MNTKQTIAAALQTVLNKTYDIYNVTHLHHWNVEGATFIELHKLFEEHYDEAFNAMDEIAERIRALEAYVKPRELSFKTSAVQSSEEAQIRTQHMIKELMSLHVSCIESAQEAKSLAAQHADQETEDLMIQRIFSHEKTLWMYRSLSKA